MKRVVILIDGTWKMEGINADTNVAKLDAGNMLRSLIKRSASGTTQEIFYHDGVGSHGSLLKRLLGLISGFGLKEIIQAC
jgi:uncharacterized protein (DUF2235 family)